MNLDAICSTLDLDPLAHGLQILDARHLARLHFPPLDPNIPALIARCNSRDLAAQCQKALLLLYPRDHKIIRVDETKLTAASHAATGDAKVLHSFANKETMRLGDLTRADSFNPETILYLPPLAQPASFNALADITAHLRAPNGCPWDRQQTHQSLRRYLLEECSEVLETLDKGDLAHLQEELGDLMSLILLQIQIAYDANEFTVTDVLAEISAKLIRRHPHVFGDVKLNGMDELLANWERIKQEEKTEAEGTTRDIPLQLPALMRAQERVRKKRPRGGDIVKRAEQLTRARNKEKALGEALFALAAYAEQNGIDAESALRAAIS